MLMVTAGNTNDSISPSIKSESSSCDLLFKEEEAKHESTKHNLNLTCRLGYESMSVINQQRCIFVTNMLFSTLR